MVLVAEEATKYLPEVDDKGKDVAKKMQPTFVMQKMY